MKFIKQLLVLGLFFTVQFLLGAAMSDEPVELMGNASQWEKILIMKREVSIGIPMILNGFTSGSVAKSGKMRMRSAGRNGSPPTENDHAVLRCCPGQTKLAECTAGNEFP